jgi:hypothetical protein
MKPANSPLGLVQLAMRALLWNLLALLISLLPVDVRYLLAPMLVPIAIGVALHWWYYSKLKSGLQRDEWPDDEVDVAQTWIGSKRWTYIAVTVQLIWLAAWIYAVKEDGPRFFAALCLSPFAIAINGFRSLLRSPDAKASWGEFAQVRSRRWIRRAPSAGRPSTGVPPPPRYAEHTDIPLS